MKIKDVMQQIKGRRVPTVSKDSDIREVIRVAALFPHTRVVYVVDEQERLMGVITIGSLMRYLYSYHYKEKIHSRDILRHISVEKASHLMSRGNIKTTPEETVDRVLKRMASTGAKELAVVDENEHILADITAVDLLKYYELPEFKFEVQLI